MSNGQFIVCDQDTELGYPTMYWTANTNASDLGRTAATSEDDAPTVFRFTGTSVSLIGNYTPGGSCLVSIVLDGDMYELSSPVVTFPSSQRTIWSSSTLTPTAHTLLYSVSNCHGKSKSATAIDSPSPYVWLDHVRSSSSLGTTDTTYFIDDTSPHAEWEGNVSIANKGGAFNSSAHVLHRDSLLRFSFAGTWASVYGHLDGNTSVQVSFSLDDRSPDTFESIYPSRANVEIYNSGPISAEEHILVMNTTSDTPISIDYFLVHSQAPAFRSQPGGLVRRGGDGEGGGVSGGVVAAGVVGGLLFLVAIGVRYWFYRRKKRTPASREFIKSVPTLTPNPFTSSQPTYPPPQSSRTHRSPSFSAGLDLGLNSAPRATRHKERKPPPPSAMRPGYAFSAFDGQKGARQHIGRGRAGSHGHGILSSTGTVDESEGTVIAYSHVEASGRPIPSTAMPRTSSSMSSTYPSGKYIDPIGKSGLSMYDSKSAASRSHDAVSESSSRSGNPRLMTPTSDIQSDTSYESPGLVSSRSPELPRTRSASSLHSSKSILRTVNADREGPEKPAATSSGRRPAKTEKTTIPPSSYPTPPASASPTRSGSAAASYRPLPTPAGPRSDDSHTTSSSPLTVSPSSPYSQDTKRSYESAQRPPRPLPPPRIPTRDRTDNNGSSLTVNVKRLEASGSVTPVSPLALPRPPPHVHTDSGLRIPAGQAHRSPLAAAHASERTDMRDELPPMYTPS